MQILVEIFSLILKYLHLKFYCKNYKYNKKSIYGTFQAEIAIGSSLTPLEALYQCPPVALHTQNGQTNSQSHQS